MSRSVILGTMLVACAGTFGTAMAATMEANSDGDIVLDVPANNKVRMALRRVCVSLLQMLRKLQLHLYAPPFTPVARKLSIVCAFLFFLLTPNTHTRARARTSTPRRRRATHAKGFGDNQRNQPVRLGERSDSSEAGGNTKWRCNCEQRRMRRHSYSCG